MPRLCITSAYYNITSSIFPGIRTFFFVVIDLCILSEHAFIKRDPAWFMCDAMHLANICIFVYTPISS